MSRAMDVLEKIGRTSILEAGAAPKVGRGKLRNKFGQEFPADATVDYVVAKGHVKISAELRQEILDRTYFGAFLVQLLELHQLLE